ncbi:hypothetical protein Hypma_004283 [Hypsizygus marmoreus]|uniref:Zn(2)-C6 fungal-type domain-containing protein n=1 Tax=Hypsizygus marmoreus TaxID=39966 RepID=A0A369J555_HYPMA|nr:hypothetical protein Hypma_004283 [Hypsizygus marmoreus]
MPFTPPPDGWSGNSGFLAHDQHHNDGASLSGQGPQVDPRRTSGVEEHLLWPHERQKWRPRNPYPPSSTSNVPRPNERELGTQSPPRYEAAPSLVQPPLDMDRERVVHSNSPARDAGQNRSRSKFVPLREPLTALHRKRPPNPYPIDTRVQNSQLFRDVGYDDGNHQLQAADHIRNESGWSLPEGRVPVIPHPMLVPGRLSTLPAPQDVYSPSPASYDGGYYSAEVNAYEEYRGASIVSTPPCSPYVPTPISGYEHELARSSPLSATTYSTPSPVPYAYFDAYSQHQPPIRSHSYHEEHHSYLNTPDTMSSFPYPARPLPSRPHSFHEPVPEHCRSKYSELAANITFMRELEREQRDEEREIPRKARKVEYEPEEVKPARSVARAEGRRPKEAKIRKHERTLDPRVRRPPSSAPIIPPPSPLTIIGSPLTPSSSSRSPQITETSDTPSLSSSDLDSDHVSDPIPSIPPHTPSKDLPTAPPCKAGPSGNPGDDPESSKRSPHNLACFFCRDRKIACGRPAEGSKDPTCNQCARREHPCDYPTVSMRGQNRGTGKRGRGGGKGARGGRGRGILRP